MKSFDGPRSGNPSRSDRQQLRASLGDGSKEPSRIQEGSTPKEKYHQWLIWSQKQLKDYPRAISDYLGQDTSRTLDDTRRCQKKIDELKREIYHIANMCIDTKQIPQVVGVYWQSVKNECTSSASLEEQFNQIGQFQRATALLADFTIARLNTTDKDSVSLLRHASNPVDSFRQTESQKVPCQEALDISVTAQTVNSTHPQLDACLTLFVNRIRESGEQKIQRLEVYKDWLQKYKQEFTNLQGAQNIQIESSEKVNSMTKDIIAICSIIHKDSLNSSKKGKDPISNIKDCIKEYNRFNNIYKYIDKKGDQAHNILVNMIEQVNKACAFQLDSVESAIEANCREFFQEFDKETNTVLRRLTEFERTIKGSTEMIKQGLDEETLRGKIASFEYSFKSSFESKYYDEVKVPHEFGTQSLGDCTIPQRIKICDQAITDFKTQLKKVNAMAKIKKIHPEISEKIQSFEKYKHDLGSLSKIMEKRCEELNKEVKECKAKRILLEQDPGYSPARWWIKVLPG